MPNTELDGINLLPYLTSENQGTPHEALYWRNFEANRLAIRTTQDKMILQPNNQFLFKIEKDLSEKENLASTDSEKLSELTQKLNAWKSLLMHPVFMGLIEDEAYSKLHPDRFLKKLNQ